MSTAPPRRPSLSQSSLNTCSRTLDTDLYIIAAGNGSRLKLGIPKALVPITDEPCLSSTLQQIGSKFRQVFIATNVRVSHQWQSYFMALEANYPELAELIINLPIESGLGDGHATLQALIKARQLEN